MKPHTPRISLLDKGLSLLYPDRCAFCGAPLIAGKTLCGNCLEKRLPGPEPRRMEARISSGHGFVCAAPFFYEDVRETLHRFKFRRRLGYLRPLALEMCRCLSEEEFDGISFVPMHPRRERQTGYNQSALLAKEISSLSGIPVAQALVRTEKESYGQHFLSAAKRRQNVRGLYRVEGTVRNQRILLIDDIVTSGSTMEECAGLLFRAGAQWVYGLCAAMAVR